MPEAAETRSRTLLPGILITVGALLLFGNLQIFHFGWVFELVLDFWPLILIAMGISRIVSGKRQDFAGGMQLIALGAFLQILVFGWLPGDLFSYWPYAMIFVGLWLIFIQPKNKRIERQLEGNALKLSEVLRDCHCSLATDSFDGGSISATLSRVECDLLGCEPASPVITLSAHVRMSSVTLFVPDDWRVVMELRCNWGQPEDRRVLGNPPEGSSAPVLKLSGSLLAGRLELRDEAVREENGENAG